MSLVTWAWTLLYGAAFAITLANLADAIRSDQAVHTLNGSTRRMVTRAGVRGEANRMLAFAAYFGVGLMALLGLFPEATAPLLVAGSLPVLVNSILDRRYRTSLLRRVR